jgi:hypothetical protein
MAQPSNGRDVGALGALALAFAGATKRKSPLTHALDASDVLSQFRREQSVVRRLADRRHSILIMRDDEPSRHPSNDIALTAALAKPGRGARWNQP